MGRDHNATLEKVLRICRQANLKLKRQMFVLVYKHTILWLGNIVIGGESSSRKGAATDGHATT